MKSAARCVLPILLVLGAFLVGALLTACQGSELGNIRASTFGQLDHGPAERGAPDALHRSECGDGMLTSKGQTIVGRLPYVQRVTERSAALVWTAPSDAGQAVLLSTDDGEVVAELPARVDESVPPHGGLQLYVEPDDLEPDALYCYQLVREGEPLTEPAGFRTAPVRGSDVPVRFVVFGDSGTGSADQFAVLDQLATVPFELMVHVGDIAYPSGTRTEFELRFFDVYAELLRSFPFYGAAGNHEYKTADGKVFREVFMLPDADPVAPERWYSFDWGPVHFVALDTNRIESRQAEWLERDLASNDLPWTVVFAHHPAYSSGSHGSKQQFRDAFGAILARHDVQLVLAGHDHNYERVRPKDGVTYVVSGGGGKGTRGVGRSDFTAFSAAVAHFIYVTVEGDELRLHAIDATGQEFDGTVIEH